MARSTPTPSKTSPPFNILMLLWSYSPTSTSSRFFVSGTIPSTMLWIVKAASRAPAAPSRWPVAPFVELTSSLRQEKRAVKELVLTMLETTLVLQREASGALFYLKHISSLALTFRFALSIEWKR